MYEGDILNMSCGSTNFNFHRNKRFNSSTIRENSFIKQNELYSKNWSNPADNPLNKLNHDPNPLLIRKKPTKPICYTQNVAVKFLKPPSPPPPGEIIIRQERDVQATPVPPLKVKHVPPNPIKPPPLVIREQPPKKPEHIPTEIHTIPGKILPPPPRKVIVEKLPTLPDLPRDIIIERWLSYPERMRNVIYKPARPLTPLPPEKNVVIQWDTPNVTLNRQVKNLGITTANPIEYNYKYGATMIESNKIPAFVCGIRPSNGERLAADGFPEKIKLVGDVAALNLLNNSRQIYQTKNFTTNKIPKLHVSFAPKVRVKKSSFKYHNYSHEYMDDRFKSC